MGVRINTNIEALIAQRNLGATATALGRSVEKLSSGLRINRAADDAAGLGISEKLRAQVRGLNQASRNAQDAISMVQTAEGALNEVHAMLQRIRELAVQYNNGTNDDSSKQSILAEVQQLAEAIGKIKDQTKFNGVALLGSATTATFQVGANEGETLQVTFGGLDTSVSQISAFLASGSVSDVFGTGATTDTASISAIDAAIGYVSEMRGTFGAAQNRLEHTINSLNVASENLAASESRIRDLDVAAEMVNFTKLQILQQAGTAILAQANQAPQSVLQLLR